jgi:MerR family transcriptional regulator, light-induced transcriptional regulator
MGTVTRLTGLSAGLLRIWERRYDLVQPHRTEGGHRMYTQQDLRLLLHVKERLDGGASIGELAQIGREALLEAAGSAPSEASQLAASPRVQSSIERWRNALADAAERLDVAALEEALDEAFSVLNADVVVYQVIHYATHEIGHRWADAKLCVAGEHLATAVFSRRMLLLLAQARGIRPGSPKALVACLPDELHALGALVQAWELSRNGYDVTWLGAALPIEALEGALRATKPTAVFLSATMPEHYESSRGALAEVITRHDGNTCWLVGGHGVPDEDPLLQDLGVGLAPELVEGENPVVTRCPTD